MIRLEQDEAQVLETTSQESSEETMKQQRRRVAELVNREKCITNLQRFVCNCKQMRLMERLMEDRESAVRVIDQTLKQQWEHIRKLKRQRRHVFEEPVALCHLLLANQNETIN